MTVGLQDDNIALIAEAQNGSKEAYDRIIRENTPLIRSVVKRFFGRGADAEELFQLGCIGMYKAIRGFDSSFGTRFSTYAVPKIEGEIRRFLRDNGSVKVSRMLKTRAAQIRNARAALSLKLGREARLSEIAAETGLAVEEIAEAELSALPVESLSAPLGEDDGHTLGDIVDSGYVEDALCELISLDEAIDGLKSLDTLQAEIIRLRFYRGFTQTQCARFLGITQVQVSRLQKKALDILRGLLMQE